MTHITANGINLCCERKGTGPAVLMIQGVGVNALLIGHLLKAERAALV